MADSPEPSSLHTPTLLRTPGPAPPRVRPRPYVWTKTADEILAKLSPLFATSDSAHELPQLLLVTRRGFGVNESAVQGEFDAVSRHVRQAHRQMWRVAPCRTRLAAPIAPTSSPTIDAS